MKSLRSLIVLSSLSVWMLLSAESFSTEKSSGAKVTEMVEIPSGSYAPLYSSDKTLRKVTGFLLDTQPVTNRQFLDFVSKNPRWKKSKVSSLFADKSYLKNWKSDDDPGESLDSAVTNVSWFAARAYAKYHNKRLPTVDEWEYVARANQFSKDATKDEKYTQVILDWYSARAPKVLPEAATFVPNIYGVYAMHGLIWEWNEDFNNAMVTGESRGDTGIERNLFCAGGALSASDVRNYAAFMRFAFRSSLKGSYTTSSLGFRCARDLNHSTQ